MSHDRTDAASTTVASVNPSRFSIPHGTQTMLELYGCPPTLLNDPSFVERAVRDAAAQARCELLQIAVHHFEPQGVTAVALLAESHLSIHTWPEYEYAAIDLFTCGESSEPEAACDLLVERFATSDHLRNTLRRGGPPVRAM
ncbi:MAG: adenosylmethionine decarboxylase [Planctomycetes bacterium]|nr:adenosylmethionine decarboxylase [Planctomycetota bacterium]